jgi:hypothetical protein
MPLPRSLVYLKREISERSPPLGGKPGFSQEVQDAARTAAEQDSSRKYQEARLEVLPTKDRPLPHRAVPELGEEPGHRPVLVVPVCDADKGAYLQELPRVGDAAEDPVGGGVEGDWEGEEPVQDPGPPCRRSVQSAGAGLPFHHGCGEAGPAPG